MNPGENVIKSFEIDQLIKSKIIDIDVDKERVSLGIKQLTKNTNKSDKLLSKTVTCVIKKIDDDKVFVTFDKDIEGFVKKSNLAKLKAEQKYN